MDKKFIFYDFFRNNKELFKGKLNRMRLYGKIVCVVNNFSLFIFFDVLNHFIHRCVTKRSIIFKMQFSKRISSFIF